MPAVLPWLLILFETALSKVSITKKFQLLLKTSLEANIFKVLVLEKCKTERAVCNETASELPGGTNCVHFF